MFKPIEDTEAVIRNLKKNKAAGADCIVAEHVIYSHPCLIVILKLLFHYDAYTVGSVALLVARRTNNQPMIGRLRVRGLLK